VRRRKAVLALFIIAVIATGAIGSLVFSRLQDGGYSDPKSDSAQVTQYLSETFNVQDPAVVLLVDAGTTLSDPDVVMRATNLENAINTDPEVTRTLSYWSSGGSPLFVSKDQKASYIFIYSKDKDPTVATDLAKRILDAYQGKKFGFTIYVGGYATFSYSISDQISKDLALAESISIPLTFILLIFVFGGLIASAMPLVVGVSAILGAFFALYLISLATGVSIFALNLVTGMGLGLGIDYSLLMVNRFREELHHGRSVEESVAITVKTAGRTVFFSGITVMITLASLMFFPLMFLKSFGYAGVTVVAMAVLGAIIPLPAILALLGHRIDKFTVRKSAITPKEDGRWAQTARFVMRRPISIVLLTLIFLGLLTAPIQNIVFSQVDAQVMPASSAIAITAKVTTERFPGQEGNPIQIIIPQSSADSPEVISYREALKALPGIERVDPIEAIGTTLRFSAIHTMSSRTPKAEQLINDIRALPAPSGTLVGGVAADYADSQAGIARTLPWALLWIAIGVLILLFAFTGSIILPIKAVILNFLSLAATMGAMSWVFVEGHMQWLTGSFTVTRTIDTSMVILIAVVAFGLSMDYELFLLSRIKEEHDSGKSNIDAVATGLQRSARIITAAAALLAVVFATFLTSGVTSIKTLGFGVAVAILIDATVVRAFLVPALMRLFGERNWWAPEWMKRFTISH
ncbi:MAG: MMPL family transporter, partial [Actinobacteria bacterium]|nr:MMPL family transporter [Actinomycetota bacterium]